MKKALLTFAIGLGILVNSASANFRGHAASILTLSSFDNALVTVELTNQRIATPSQIVRLNGLRPGTHWIRVVKHQLNPHGYGTVARVAYEGHIRIPARSKVFAKLNGRNNLFIKRVVPLQAPVVRPNTQGYGRGSTGGNYGRGSTRGNYGRGSTAPVTCQPVQPVRQPIQQPAFGMDHRVFEDLKYSIHHNSFDNTRLAIARQGIAAHGASAQQVLELMNLLSFENTKLDLAKFAYQYTVDPSNYFVVNNGFTFSSSVRELDRFIYG